MQEIVRSLTFESVLSIEGKVIRRPDGQENKRMKTGDIEVTVESLKVLNKAKAKLPFVIRDYNKAKEAVQLKYRYISLRYPELQKCLRLRSKVIMKMREYLINECGFVDVETPTLFKKTPEVCMCKFLFVCYSFVEIYKFCFLCIIGCSGVRGSNADTGTLLFFGAESSTIQTAINDRWF